MNIDILTLFPGMFRGPLDESILKRAQEAGIVRIALHDLRSWATDRHRTVDDRPFGGGPGMVLKPDIVFAAVEAMPHEPGTRIVLTCPQGKLFDQAAALELASCKHVVFLCGHYEGIDERVREHLVSDAFSIGDYVLTGGELPAMVMVDAIVRLLPGALGARESAEQESFREGLLDFPQYTRPADFRGWKVPAVLLGGDHAEVGRWRRRAAILRTLERRPDLLRGARLEPNERAWLAREHGWS
ncbi:MAG: tRNA (guanosine(37)-N1)-methyltransferase TrmD [Cyanobacteria bacterium REEB65]|nr:tRNA (guanosine(37)-N1)-methyltransferase TrmD [Cyanobacteria bacterium REEB65]